MCWRGGCSRKEAQKGKDNGRESGGEQRCRQVGCRGYLLGVLGRPLRGVQLVYETTHQPGEEKRKLRAEATSHEKVFPEAKISKLN